MPLWQCPNGKHKAVLGPTRPHADNLCRYCLDCSEDAGKLVRRSCGMVEKKRAEKQMRRKERLKERAASERAKAAAYPRSLNGDFKRWGRLKAWQETDFSKWRFELRVRARTPNNVFTSGRCFWWQRRIVVTAGSDEAWARYVVLHEQAHAAMRKVGDAHRENGHRCEGPEWETHGSIFRSVLKTAVEEVVGHRVEMKAYTSYDEWRRPLVAAIRAWMTPKTEAAQAPMTPGAVTT